MVSLTDFWQYHQIKCIWFTHPKVRLSSTTNKTYFSFNCCDLKPLTGFIFPELQ